MRRPTRRDQTDIDIDTDHAIELDEHDLEEITELEARQLPARANALAADSGERPIQAPRRLPPPLPLPRHPFARRAS